MGGWVGRYVGSGRVGRRAGCWVGRYVCWWVGGM